VQNRNISQDEFIIIACDGIWDVQTNYGAIKEIAEMFNEGETEIGLMCEEVRLLCCVVLC
jgi:serine/threonine protein phosphatase PrpC